MSWGLIGKLGAPLARREEFRARRSINQSAPHKPSAINHDSGLWRSITSRFLIKDPTTRGRRVDGDTKEKNEREKERNERGKKKGGAGTITGARGNNPATLLI